MDKENSLINIDLSVGLTIEQVNERKEKGLVNKTKKGSSKTYTRIISSNIFTFFNFVIGVIAGMLIAVQAYKDLFFVVIVLLNIIIGIIQEIKAKKTIDKLSLLSAPVGRVLRDGEIVEIPIDEIVLDDIMSLKAGNEISADAILKEGFIEVDESLLTGESDVIDKKPGDVLYSGSFVVSGQCLAQTTKVGSDSYIETLTSKARLYKKPQSNLMGSLKIMIRVIAVLIIPLGYALFRMHRGLLGEPFDISIQHTAGALVGMIPSGLFLLTSVALAVGVIRLAQNNTLVQELYCIEMLARVDTLCLDKTGTITDGSMSVKGIVKIDKESIAAPQKMIAQLLYVLNDSNQTNEALVSAFGKIEPEYKVSQVVPFSSRRKLSAASFEGLGTLIMGAPEFVLTPTEQKRIETRSREYLEQGLRVLVFAHSKNEIKGKNLPTGVKAVSLILIEDNIRRDAIYTINFFKENNVDLKVISGDNAVTVSHIAERAGIRDADKYISLEGLTDKQVREAAPKYNVFGRVSPEQKQLLIESLKESGRTVGMVGDGVNDILALKEADASIAMASGSEATRNVSHLVLLDSSFSSMPKVVSEGRRVINNVQNVATIFLTKTIFSMLLTLIVLALNVTYPLTPSQLFIIDFLAIGIPSFFISLQPNNKLVKGTFLKNVLKSATPGAFAMVAQVVLIITYLGYKLNLSILEQNALVVITASFTAMVVLYRTLKPLNTYRRTLFIVMFTIATLAVFLLPEFFNFSALTPFYIRMGMAEVELISFSCATLLLVMLLSSPILINLFEKVPHWIKVGTSWILRKLTGI